MTVRLINNLFSILIIFLICVTVQLPSMAEEEAAAQDEITIADPVEKKPMEFPMAVRAVLRNDAVYTLGRDEDSDFSDILESRVVLEKIADKWKFYADGRLYLYYGDAAARQGKYETKLMRTFIRYYSKAGDITLGKTYVNFGNPGLFNPFEQDKNVILTDLSYDKEGMMALEYHYALGSLAGWKLYGGADVQKDAAGEYSTIYRGGASLWTTISGFDLGAVVMRNDTDRNMVGTYFKGDFIVGINGSWALHMDDNPDSPAGEATGGIDYSFFDGQLILTALFYYNQRGQEAPASYTYSPEYYFAAPWYCYNNIDFRYDEFFSAGIDMFTNCADGSMIISPSCSVVIANGLTATLLFTVLTGDGSDEFAPARYGRFGTLIRIEGKF